MPQSTPRERLLDGGSLVASAVPHIGGPLSNIISGIAQGRRMNRVISFLSELSERLRLVEIAGDARYLKSDEFEELLEQALHRVAAERHASKRAVYREFLADVVVQPKCGYDEQLAFIRTLEQIQPDHLRVLWAMAQPPGDTSSMLTWSPGAALRRRLPGMVPESIRDRVAELNDFRLAKMNSLNTMMTPDGAENLAGSITPSGHRFLKYILEAPDDGDGDS